jgi:diguanylate cyclase (GGDEF)-like protein
VKQETKKKRRPLSIRHTLWLAVGLTVVSTVLGASALYGHRLYRINRQAKRVRVQVVAETYACQFEPLILGVRSELRRFVEKVAWHPDTCLLAVVDSQGKPVAVRGYSSLMERYSDLYSSFSSSNQIHTWHVPASDDGQMPGLILTTVPIRVADSSEPVGRVVYGARLSKTLESNTSEVGAFFSQLVLISVTGLVLGIFWLKRKVLEPLTLLTHQSKKVRTNSKQLSLPTERTDEIGELARVLSGMSLDIDGWRERVERLEISVSHRVTAETEKIICKLRDAEERSWKDPVSGLGNRLLYEEKFVEIFDAQQRVDQDLSLVMLDVDNFKNINDTLGHKTGDNVLSFVGELLKQHLREQDLAIRYGGDEFVMILPSVSVDDAKAIAERTICMFAQQTKLLDINPKPTMSAGVASLKGNHPESSDDLLHFSDRALYEAKRQGKSRATIYVAESEFAAVGN